MFDRHLYDRMLKKESIEDKIVNMSAGAFFLLIIISLLALVRSIICATNRSIKCHHLKKLL